MKWKKNQQHKDGEEHKNMGKRGQGRNLPEIKKEIGV
jgi:hypothetical protein